MHVVIAAPVRFTLLEGLVDQPIPLMLDSIGGGTPGPQLARALRDAGDRVTLVTLARGLTRPLHLRGDVDVHVGPYRPSGRARDAFRPERAFVAGAVEAIGADAVHAHWSYEFALGSLASRPDTIVTVRDWAPTVLRYSPDPYRAVRFGMNAVVLRRARHLTTLSPQMRDRVSRWARGPVELIPNAVPDSDFVPEAGLPQPRTSAPVVVAVANWFGRLKNVHTLLRAWPAVLAAHPDATLRLIGTEQGVDEPAHAWALERGLGKGVDFVGHLPHRQAMDAIGEAHLMVHASLEESFGLVVVEAMARGVPVIGGASSGAVPYVLDEGRAGVLTDVLDPTSIAREVVALLDDEDRRRSLARDGWKWSRDTFRVSAVATRYRDLYERVATGDSSGGGAASLE